MFLIYCESFLLLDQSRKREPPLRTKCVCGLRQKLKRNGFYDQGKISIRQCYAIGRLRIVPIPRYVVDRVIRFPADRFGAELRVPARPVGWARPVVGGGHGGGGDAPERRGAGGTV